MMDADLQTIEPAFRGPPSLVPMGYAEKAMASLMQLHSELMDEKERRVDLYRRLMDKEQVVAELRMYVQLLEEKLAAKEDGWGSSRNPVFRPSGLRPVPSAPTETDSGGPGTQAPQQRASSSPRPYRATAFVAAADLHSLSGNGGPSDGWRTW